MRAGKDTIPGHRKELNLTILDGRMEYVLTDGLRPNGRTEMTHKGPTEGLDAGIECAFFRILKTE
jgi:hypothetical protein